MEDHIIKGKPNMKHEYKMEEYIIKNISTIQH